MSNNERKPLTTSKGEVLSTPVSGVPNTIDQRKPPGARIATATAPTQPIDPDNIDIDKFIADNTAEIVKGEQKESERKKKTDYLTKAIDSRFKYERLIFNNTETEEFVGHKLRYLKDEDKKTVYDYMEDPLVKEHIQFIVHEDDPRDGSPVNHQVSFFWLKPTF